MNDTQPTTRGPLHVPFRFDSVPLLWTIDDVYTAEECDQFIRMIERADPDLATNNPLYRDQDRVMIDDFGMADQLFERIRDALPAEIGNFRLDRINERLRFYRYRRGQKFVPHMDHWYNPSETEISLFTVLAYLNSGFAGGETVFMEQLTETVYPIPGRVAIFQHKIRHEGCEVLSGIKYAFRTEVMYRLEEGSGR